ncbi:hypothetical protein BKA69DRAFT_1071625 [Paraphysoderma sedebokerense]|nr:hypothetical protein BKA69DRAFT_1071625 [Paraphysoderma sedebokerense]
MDTALRSHNITFSVNPLHRQPLSSWASEVRQFLSTLTPHKLQSQSLTHSVQIFTDPSQAESTFEPSFPHFEDVLESVTVNLAVQLISNLWNPIETVRIQSIHFLWSLAGILDSELNSKYGSRLVNLNSKFQVDGHGLHEAIHELFNTIGPSLSDMSVALVAGLECFYTVSNQTIRAVCVTALTRIIHENQKVFLEEDHLAAIWNLFFTLQSEHQASKYYPERLVIIKALHLLAPLYCLEDIVLTYRIVECLLKLKKKTKLETACIKDTLVVIFSEIGAKSDLYKMFLGLVNPHDENPYDLLPWTIEQYYSKSVSETTDRIVSVKEVVGITKYIESLMNHFQATHPLVRFGAALTLHSAVIIEKALLAELPQIYVYIVSGLLDSDFAVSTLYMSLVQRLNGGTDGNLSNLIGLYQRTDVSQLNYDTLYVTDTNGLNNQSYFSQIIDEFAKDLPALSVKMLHKMAASLEYFPKNMKLKQLNLLRLWSGKMEKFDTPLLQSMLPFLTNTDQDIQIAALRVLSNLSKSFPTATSSDISMLWPHFKALMNHKNLPLDVLQEVLKMWFVFPINKLSGENQFDLCMTLYKLFLHKSRHVRFLVYDLFGSKLGQLTGADLNGNSVAILIMALGEQDRECLHIVIRHIAQAVQIRYPGLLDGIRKLQDITDQPTSFKTIECFGSIANALLRDREEYETLLRIMTSDDIVDAFWNFFLHDVPENFAMNPDEYNYSRASIHSPYWISILLTKFSVRPPPYPATEKRTTVPATVGIRRRYIAGFMLASLPLCGIPDKTSRHLACLTMVRCCFRQSSNLMPSLLRALLDFISLQFIMHQSWAFQTFVSALDIIKAIIKLKLPQISQYLTLQYMDTALDIIINNPNNLLRIGAIELVETVLMVFPRGMSSKLQDIRDTIRIAVMDKAPEISWVARRVWPLVFRSAPSESALEYSKYIVDENAVIMKGGVEAAGDPFIKHLEPHEKKEMVMMNLLALSAMKHRQSASQNCRECLKYIVHSDPDFRNAALNGLLSQSRLLPDSQKPVILWIVLPLYGDSSAPFRLAFSRFIRKLPSALDIACDTILPYPDDTDVMTSGPLEEILPETAILSVTPETLSYALPFNDSPVSYQENDGVLALEDDHLNLHTMSVGTVAKLKTLVRDMTTKVPEQYISEVLYYLQEFLSIKSIAPFAVLVLSEFACAHDGVLASIQDVWLAPLKGDLKGSNRVMTNSCLLALHNVSETLPDSFRNILSKISTAIPTDSSIFALISLCDFIKAHAAHKLPDLMKKHLLMMSSPRYATSTRVWAAQLCVKLALIDAEGQIESVAEAMLVLFKNAEEGFRTNLYGPLKKILQHLTPDHELFKTLIESAKTDIASPVFSNRQRGFSLFRIISPSLIMQEKLWFCLRGLSDPRNEIRRMVIETMIRTGEFDFLNDQVGKIGVKEFMDVATEFRNFLSQPPVHSLVISDQDDLIEELEQPSVSNYINDKFNSEYYASKKRKMLCRRYKLKEDRFDRFAKTCATDFIESCSNMPYEDALTQDQQLLLDKVSQVDSLIILRECLRKFSTQAVSVMDDILGVLENLFNKITLNSSHDDTEKRLLSATHALKNLSELLVASDGVIDQHMAYVERLRQIISACSERAQKIREELYADMERSLFFFNEYSDIPITSDEQYEALESLKLESQEATLEAVRTGQFESFHKFQDKKMAMNEIIDNKTEMLRKFTVLQLHATVTLGGFYMSAFAISEESVIQGFQFLIGMLTDEHRAVRAIAVEAAAKLVASHSSKNSQSETALISYVQKVVKGFINEMKDPDNMLYRRRVDMIILVSRVSAYISDNEIRVAVINLLVDLWIDPDSEVRVTAIKMVQALCEQQLPEVISGFRKSSEPLGPKAAPVDLMSSIAKLISNTEYTEKDLLTSLLNWRCNEETKLRVR